MKPRHALLAVITILMLAPSGLAASKQVYFKNNRVVEARSYEVKGFLIYLTLSNGSIVAMKAADVDWESTKTLAGGGHMLHKDLYEGEAEEAEGEAYFGAGRILTARDLKGFRGAARQTRAGERRDARDREWQVDRALSGHLQRNRSGERWRQQ